MIKYKVIHTFKYQDQTITTVYFEGDDYSEAKEAFEFLAPYFPGHLAWVEETTTVETRTLSYA